MFKKVFAGWVLASSLAPLISNAATFEGLYEHPFYVGFTGGYGSTTWFGLVPPKKKQSDAILLSTPINAREGGAIWGFVAGYEFVPFFALEGSYTRYPDATIDFDEESLVTFEHDGLTEFVSKTETLSLMAKFMMEIPHTNIRAYSSAGVARIHRKDVLREINQLSPTFGVGFNYSITPNAMAEIGFNYTSGYGESELDPAEDYVPFLYSAFARLVYRFG